MPEKWSEFVQATEEKESWLAAAVEKEGDGSCDTTGLLATAALARGAINAIDVPESVQSQSRTQGLTLLAEAPARPNESSRPPQTWLGRLGSAIQVAFNLFKRR